jgi:anaerobic selenocysteine-containing dehydrogenase
LRRRRGEAGFRRVSWDEALSVLAGGLRATTPDRTALYLTSRGITNETYYVAAKATRALGVANIDSAARVCHAPSTVGLKQTIGVAATTCSFQDVIEAPLVVLWGSNPANNQPVFMKYLYLARRRGCRVVVVNPYLEPGLERYWVPSNVESALFGTKMCDLHVPVRPGGDVALANAALQRLIARGAVDRPFVDAHTEGFDEVAMALAGQDPDHLLALAGVDRPTLESFVDELAQAGGAIHVWSMGITQHRGAAETVRGFVNLALAREPSGATGWGSCPSAATRACRGAPRWAPTPPPCPGACPSIPTTPPP